MLTCTDLNRVEHFSCSACGKEWDTPECPDQQALLLDVARSANFSQQFKMLIWQKSAPDKTLPSESDLDLIASKMWAYAKKSLEK